MAKRPKLTTEVGAPVGDNQHSQTAEPPRWTRMKMFSQVGKNPKGDCI
jgi:hypothetical protein